MKKFFRIFNIFLMAAALGAIACLFLTPTLKVNVSFTMTPEQIAQTMPQTSGEEGSSTSGIDYKKILGEDGVTLNMGIEVKSSLLIKSIGGDSSKVIKQEFIDPNVSSIIESFREPLNKLGKNMFVYAISLFYTNTMESLIDSCKDSNDARANADIRVAAGLDDAYFMNIGNEVYDTANSGKATVKTVSDKIFNSLTSSITTFNNAKVNVTIPDVGKYTSDEVNDQISQLLDSLGMVKEDGETLYPMQTVMDAKLVDAFDSSNKNGETTENTEQKAARLNAVLTDYITKMIPANSYDMMSTILIILLAVIGLFALTWAIFFIWTFCRTVFGKYKVYAFTGPFFWILGVIQIILGIGVTVATKFLLTGDRLASMMGQSGGSSADASAMLKGFSMNIQTCTLIPSIILLVFIPTMIVYAVLKSKYKKQLRQEREQKLIAEQNPSEKAPK